MRDGKVEGYNEGEQPLPHAFDFIPASSAAMP
jgi:hypothetical protein